MGMYEFRVTKRGQASDDFAIRLAKERAYARGIRLFGKPTVDRRRVPLPLVGPRTRFVVRYAASREARHARSDEALW